MASFLPTSFLLLPLAFLLLISPASSQNCASQTFTNNKLYSTCTDLPTLGAFLHWSYNNANSTLSVAFLAPPAKSNGWIAWAINPTGVGMIGAQSLIAFKHTDGSMGVTTYNISSYSLMAPSKLSFDVLESSAEFSGGLMKIFATVVLPESLASAGEVNQVWQVGSSVTKEIPDIHELKPANKGAKQSLKLGVEARRNGAPVGSPTLAPTPGVGSRAGEGPSSGKNGSTRMEINLGVCVFLMFFGGLLGLSS